MGEKQLIVLEEPYLERPVYEVQHTGLCLVSVRFSARLPYGILFEPITVELTSRC